MPNLADPNLKYDPPAELLSAERLAQSALEQRQLAERVNSPFANRTPQDIQRFNASILISETEQLLSVTKLKDLNYAVREQYAESLAEVGRFADAVKATADKEKKKFYKDIVKAIDKDDNELCECPRANKNGTYNTFAEAEIWSERHGKRMPVIKCNLCGHRNVKKLPEHIAKAREQRKMVQSHTSGKTHSDGLQIMTKLGIKK